MGFWVHFCFVLALKYEIEGILDLVLPTNRWVFGRTFYCLQIEGILGAL